ncbi:hypothetical protein SERMPA_00038 (plasmid) [Serratia marcescens]
MTKNNQFSPEVRQRALLQKSAGDKLIVIFC